MKKQIIRISPAQTAKVFAALYFIMSIPLVAIMSIGLLAAPNQARAPFWLLLSLPLAYLILGFVFTVIGAWIYNMVARWIGGIEYTSIERF